MADSKMAYPADLFFSNSEEVMAYLRTVLSSKEFKMVRLNSNKVFIDGELYTVKYINVVNDDVLYKNSTLWTIVPRGFFEVVDPAGKTVYIGTGMRKFVYLGTKGYEHALPIDRIIEVVAMEKENGECGHAGAFYLNEKRYWIVCSKHVPVIYEHGKLPVYLAQYNDTYSKTAVNIAKIWNEELAPLNAIALHEYMAENGYMINFEAIIKGSEHVVSYEKTNIAICFSITKHSPFGDGLTALDPKLAVDFFEEYGLRSAAISPVLEFGSPEYELYLREVTARRGSEGVVVYGMNAGRVICVFKWKAILYDLERMIREALYHGEFLSDILAKITKYSSSCSSEELAIVLQWKDDRLPQLLSFYKWLVHTGVVKMGVALDKDESYKFRSKYLTLQKHFEDSSVEEKLASESVVLDSSGKKKNVVVLIGPPGSGKSSLLRAIFHLLSSHGLKVVLVNQDELDGNRAFFLREIKSAMEDSTVDFILVDKSNLDPRNRNDLKDVGVTEPCYIQYYYPGDDKDHTAFKALCEGRITDRTGHRTIKKDKANVSDILEMMFSCYVPLDPDETVHLLSVLDDPVTAVRNACLMIEYKFSDEEIIKAVKIAREYEEVIGTEEQTEKQKIRFGSIEVQSEMIMSLLKQIPPEALVNKKIQGKFHITIRFLNTFDPVWYVKFFKMIGEKVLFEVYEIVWDKNVVAMRVRGDFECANEFPHITIALAKGVKPFESNAMLAAAMLPASETSKVTLDVPVSMTSVYKAN